MNRGLVYLSVISALGFSLIAMGCTRRTERLDRRDENHPLIKRAIARKQAQDIDRAIELFQKALERKASLARAHLELGLLYDQELEDYVRAIYHYERYLEKRPHAEKRELIRELIQHARLSFAASLPDQPSASVKRIANLQREIERLRYTIESIREKPTLPSPVSGASSEPALNPSPAANREPPTQSSSPDPAETYLVERGDSLSRIAIKMYGNASEWTRLFDANRHILDQPGSVRPGQRLIVPRNEGSPPP